MHLFFLFFVGYMIIFGGRRNIYPPRTTMLMAVCGLWAFVSFAMLLCGGQP